MSLRKARVLLLVLLLAPSFIVLGSSSSASPSALVGSEAGDGESFQGPEYCSSCHSRQASEWSESPHALAYEDQKFLDEWKNLNSPVSCLRCHTTGFNPTEGTFKFEGVTCEQCHGPGDTMEIDESVELCATCHSDPYPTFEEWRSSPGHMDVTCNDCHEPHSLRITADSPTDLCSSCHETQFEKFEETRHGSAGVDCIDCHMYKRPADFRTRTAASTGHAFSMTPQQLDCTSCHDRPLFKHDVLGEGASACLSCHGEIHGLELKLLNGTVYSMEESAKLCGQCHSERYAAWRQGTHGKYESPYAPCTECHDPHNPVVAGIPTLPPLPPREPAPSPPTSRLIILVAVIELLGIAVILYRGKEHA